MGRLNGFDRIAPFYDLLSAIAFAGAIKRSQLHFLSELPPSGRILILGGGTGWIAQEILIRCNCSIVYVDASSKMITLSKKKLSRWDSRIEYVHGTEINIDRAIQFDGIIANFYFDLFADNKLRDVLKLVKQSMNNTGQLFVSDFVDANQWHRVIIGVMYSFFRKVAGLETSRLPDWYEVVCQEGFTPIKERSFFLRFIKSVLFARSV